MIGYLVRHRQLGVGKVISAQRGALRVHFLDSRQEHSLSPAAFNDGTLARENLSVGARCRLPGGGECVVYRIAHRPGNLLEPFAYQVTREGGELGVVSEVDLLPSGGNQAPDPLARLIGLGAQEYELFRRRQTLSGAFARVLRDSAGLQALLASRVDMRPHQAFVAGTVMSDCRRRYILADEVGLGKTIEAGIVMHDLLLRKPNARILVVCPGALTNQWLSEIFSKFGGQLFTLLDLHDPLVIRWRELRKVIVSTTLAGYRFSSQLGEIQWDMMVVDEAHHLLASPVLYDFVQRLSRQAPSLLLLSAIPAHQREDELLKLLALLEPERYRPSDAQAGTKFATLYGLQPQLGRRLRLLSSRLDGLALDEYTPEDAMMMARRLLELPAVCDDDALHVQLAAAEPASPHLAADLRQFAHTVADRYRLNRRVLRNRRQRLIEQSQIVAVERRARLLPYRPDQLEIEALDAVSDLLRGMRDGGLDAEILASFARVLLQSTVVPAIAHDLLQRLKRSAPKAINERGRDLVTMGHTVGYADWALYSEVLFWSTRGSASTPLIDRALRHLAVWRDAGGRTARWEQLITLLEEKQREEPQHKLLVFAGFPGVAQLVSEGLRAQYGDDVVADFRAELEPELKEQNVARFRDQPETWMLVSDETGGEGRNFQFASEIVHFDTPWSAARIEQRIGRLDRLGRESVRLDVTSNVLFSGTSCEAGLVRCYHDGLHVYTTSISGLEFALRDVERSLLRTAVDSGQEGLEGSVAAIADAARRERESDDSEAVLDEASFERTAAAKFLQIGRSDGSERSLEEAFVSYFRALGGGHGVHARTEHGQPEGVWRFRPEETRYGALPVDAGGKEVLVGNHDGTFRRTVAQQRPRLEFFNVGNPLFDAVIRSLSLHATGRVYAVECLAPGEEPWVGFEFVFTAAPNRQLLEGNAALLNQAEAAFAPARPVHLFYSADGAPVQDTHRLLGIRARLAHSQQGVTWWDLATRSREALPGAVGTGDWQDVLLGLNATAAAEAKARLSGDLAWSLRAEHASVAEARTRAEREGAADECAALDRLVRAITEWHVVLDGVGLLSVNGKLHAATR